ncbi:hypothetical protein ABT024_05165 [Streptomyces sp. NPDC002812]|uniref:hypothetical protein n=1 Tax=Streptomyces sp. NPDC002812 TaxID=3154434 RepID=UPI00331EA12A
MSVSLDKVSCAPDAEPPLYVVVQQNAGGRVTRVDVTDTAPDPYDVFTDNVRATVWSTPLAEYEGETAYAVKILDAAMTSAYRHDDGHGWSEGERIAGAFYNGHTPQRAHLRTTEAHLIHAGLTNVYTGVTHGQGYGLTIVAAQEYTVHAEPTAGGWKFAMTDELPGEDWCVDPGVIAPMDAAPRQLAKAVLVRLAEHGAIEMTELPLLLRLRTVYARRRVLASNARYRARQTVGRYRRRITARTR